MPKGVPYHYYQNRLEFIENCSEEYFSDANICLIRWNESPYFIKDDIKKKYNSKIFVMKMTL